MKNPIAREALGKTDSCPPIEVLGLHLGNSPEDPARVAAENHLRGCQHCKTEMDLLSRFESGSVESQEVDDVAWITAQLGKQQQAPPSAKQAPPSAKQAPRSAKKETSPWWRKWTIPQIAFGLGSAGAIAAVMLAVSAGIKSRDARLDPIPEFRNETSRSLSIPVVDTPGAFAWKPVAGATRYEVTLRTVSGAIVFHKFLTEQTLAFPPEVAQVTSKGKLLLWDVVALDANAAEIARSGVKRLPGRGLQ